METNVNQNPAEGEAVPFIKIHIILFYTYIAIDILCLFWQKLFRLLAGYLVSIWISIRSIDKIALKALKIVSNEQNVNNCII